MARSCVENRAYVMAYGVFRLGGVNLVGQLRREDKVSSLFTTTTKAADRQRRGSSCDLAPVFSVDTGKEKAGRSGKLTCGWRRSGASDIWMRVCP